MTSSLRLASAAAGLLAAALALALVAYWPGIMTWDAVREYRMALRGPIDDWHPPAMIWLWRQLARFAAGPGPMLALQLALYGGGWTLLARCAWRRDRRGLAVALAGSALFPIALAIEGAVLKDCLMAGALLAAAGLLAPDAPSRAARIAAGMLLIVAATLRFNAFLACWPWLMVALPQPWRRTPARQAAAIVAAAAVLLAATPLANRLIGAARSGVELSQVLFDLGGITYHAGVDAFPALGVRDPVAVNRRCYKPELWDPYAWWTADPCPIGFVSISAALKRSGESPYALWLRAMAAHPIAYAEHRLRHFNANSRFLVADAPGPLVPDQPDPNPWGYRAPANPVRTAIDGAAALLAHSPLGWPVWWIAVAAGLLTLPRSLPMARLVRLAAGSALLYGGGYLVLSVASDLRYHLWTMIGALLAALVAGSDLVRRPPSRGRIALAAAPMLMVTVLGAAARW